MLLALDPALDSPIDRNIAETLQESRELESVLGKMGKEIYARSNLDRAVGQSLDARGKLLETAESAWAAHREAALSRSLRAVRADAEDLKRDFIAALRHFRRDRSHGSRSRRWHRPRQRAPGSRR
ncbi:MAG: hypothetical protein ABJE95_20765 [Byssovorax sp.]